jgi:hypothetical protein
VTWEDNAYAHDGTFVCWDLPSLPSIAGGNYNETGAASRALSFGCRDITKTELLKQIWNRYDSVGLGISLSDIH